MDIKTPLNILQVMEMRLCLVNAAMPQPSQAYQPLKDNIASMAETLLNLHHYATHHPPPQTKAERAWRHHVLSGLFRSLDNRQKSFTRMINHLEMDAICAYVPHWERTLLADSIRILIRCEILLQNNLGMYFLAETTKKQPILD